MTIMTQVSGYEGLYSVTNDGRVWSHHRNKFLKPRPSNGYLRVVLQKNGKVKKEFIHRLVLKAFVPNPKNKPYTNHLNGNKADNRVQNLEWVTQSENELHAYRTGLKYPTNPNKNGRLNGERNGRSKLTIEQVREIRLIGKTRKYGEKLWKKYGITDTMFHNIVKGKNWKVN